MANLQEAKTRQIDFFYRICFFIPHPSDLFMFCSVFFGGFFRRMFFCLQKKHGGLCDERKLGSRPERGLKEAEEDAFGRSTSEEGLYIVSEKNKRKRTDCIESPNFSRRNL